MNSAQRVVRPVTRRAWKPAGLLLAAVVLAWGLRAGGGEGGIERVRALPDKFPGRPTLAPSWSIPAAPLGFAAPGPVYLGMRYAMASLDFLGEDHLLFTFHVPGLLVRNSSGENQHPIRAVVLSVSTGAVLAETNWTVHDRWRYVWPIDDEHFLLRNNDTVYEGNSALDLRPLLKFPGPLLSIGLSPGLKYMTANSIEPAGTTAGAHPPDNVGSAEASAQPPDTVFRILLRATGKVLLVTRVRTPLNLPIGSEGYLSVLPGQDDDWMVVRNDFSGATQVLGTVKSDCQPALAFISEDEALATRCTESGDALTALTTAGTALWTDFDSGNTAWPLLVASRNGLRLARESLYVARPVSALAPIDSDDVKGQWVRVLDAATGALAFESPATPVFDAGGNVAISPSGRRVAVLNAGAIQIFELPVPPPLPAPKAVQPAP